MSESRDDTDQMPVTISKGVRRRDFLGGVATTMMVVGLSSRAFPQPKEEMYGEIGRITVVSGKRDEVIANILEGIRNIRLSQLHCFQRCEQQ